MVTRSSGRPHTFVLDSNVLIHDPTALFRFAEHGIYLTMAVLEALDAAKNGASEAARNAREATRALDELLTANAGQDIAAGLALTSS